MKIQKESQMSPTSSKIITYRATLKEIVEQNGMCFLYSYGKCVALYIPGRGFRISNPKENTQTTNKHINAWLNQSRVTKKNIPIETQEKIEFCANHPNWNILQVLNYFGMAAY